MNLTTQNPNFVASVREKMKGQFFLHHIGFDLGTIELGIVTGKMKFEKHHLQQFGFLHGGVTATLMDVTMGFAAFTLVAENQGVVTANLNIDFIKPGEGDTIEAIGWVEKPSAGFNVCKAEVFTIKEGVKTKIASATSVMAVVTPQAQ
jgi:uncharacterized protein (TIGR00369 family)